MQIIAFGDMRAILATNLWLLWRLGRLWPLRMQPPWLQMQPLAVVVVAPWAPHCLPVAQNAAPMAPNAVPGSRVPPEVRGPPGTRGPRVPGPWVQVSLRVRCVPGGPGPGGPRPLVPGSPVPVRPPARCITTHSWAYVRGRTPVSKLLNSKM